MKPAAGLDARDHAVLAAANARDLAVLDDVDPAAVRPARIAPGDRVMAHGAARRCRSPPWIGKRALSKFKNGSIARTAARSSSSASTPCSRMALPRRA